MLPSLTPAAPSGTWRSTKHNDDGISGWGYICTILQQGDQPTPSSEGWRESEKERNSMLISSTKVT